MLFLAIMISQPTIAVFYDGACHLCSREIEHYRKIVPADQVSFVDIASATFVPERYKLDKHEVQKYFHVIKNGAVFRGVDAFIELWQVIPRYRKFATIAKLPGFHFLLQIAYVIFARGIRPILPKRNCDDNTCSR